MTHAQKRALQRYGVQLGPGDLEVIVARINRGDALFQRACPNGSQEYLVAHQGRVMRVVYAPLLGAILTFLPLEAGLFGRKGMA